MTEFGVLLADCPPAAERKEQGSRPAAFLLPGYTAGPVCVVAIELALVQCFAIRFLTNPKTIMQ